MFNNFEFAVPPKSEAELLEKCDAIAGLPIGCLAEIANVEVPSNMVKAKGWLGGFLEYILGATASNKSEPDFQSIGVELKSMPVVDAKPRESTYVCHIHLKQLHRQTWAQSEVLNKLKRVLWLPFEGNTKIPLAERRLGQGFIWSPSENDLKVLRQDWQELTDQLSMGEVDEVTAFSGEYLQVRPKAPNARARCKAIGEDGKVIQTLPRGFYLRVAFTKTILSSCCVLS